MKKKHVLKTKEQLIADLKKSQKFVEKMKFAREVFYPALIKMDSSVDDTKMFLASINTVLMEEFLGEMKKMNFDDLKLGESLDPKDEKYQWYIEILKCFDGKNVFDAKDLIEGMRSEIETFENDMMKGMLLKDLPTKWIDQL